MNPFKPHPPSDTEFGIQFGIEHRTDRNRAVFNAGVVRVAIGLLAIGVMCSGLLAQESSSSAVQKWVAGLGADDYLLRLKSEEQLLNIGSPAIDAVREASQSPEVEIRIRAGRLLVNLLDQDFQRRKNAFLAAGSSDPPEPGDYGFDQWDRFSQIAGGHDDSRKLFIEIIKHRRQKYAARRLGNSNGYFGYLSDQSEPYTPLPSTAIEIADELFYQIVSNQPIEQHTHQGVIIQQLVLSGFEANLPKTMVSIVNESRYSEEIRALIEYWIRKKQHRGLLTNNQIEIIYRFDLGGFTDNLLAMLAMEGTQRRISAAQAIAKTGGPDAVNLLSRFLSGDDVVVVYAQSELGRALPITIGDIAFQLILEVQEIPFKDFGLLPTAGTMVLNESPVYGFADRVAAESAIERWQSGSR